MWQLVLVLLATGAVSLQLDHQPFRFTSPTVTPSRRQLEGAETTCTTPAASHSGGCRATQNYIIMLDNSDSTLDASVEVKQDLLRSFVNQVDLDPLDPDSPKIGIVVFTGNPQWTVEVRAATPTRSSTLRSL